MGLQTVGIPRSGHGHMADVKLAGQHPCAPVGGPVGFAPQSHLYDLLAKLFFDPSSAGTSAGILSHPSKAFLFEAAAPEDDRGPGKTKLASDHRIRFSIPRPQANQGPGDQFLRCLGRLNPSQERSFVFRIKVQVTRNLEHKPIFDKIEALSIFKCYITLAGC